MSQPRRRSQTSSLEHGAEGHPRQRLLEPAGNTDRGTSPASTATPSSIPPAFGGKAVPIPVFLKTPLRNLRVSHRPQSSLTNAAIRNASWEVMLVSVDATQYTTKICEAPFSRD